MTGLTVMQDVAVKVLHTTDDVQINQFCLEIKLLKSLSFDRNIVQFLGVCLHSGNPMLVRLRLAYHVHDML